jgi:hypothetical protein
MIKNEHQFEISCQKLKELRQALLKLRKKYPRKEDFEFYSLGVREHVEQIEEEIESYLSISKSKNIGEFPTFATELQKLK